MLRALLEGRTGVWPAVVLLQEGASSALMRISVSRGPELVVLLVLRRGQESVLLIALLHRRVRLSSALTDSLHAEPGIPRVTEGLDDSLRISVLKSGETARTITLSAAAPEKSCKSEISHDARS